MKFLSNSFRGGGGGNFSLQTTASGISDPGGDWQPLSDLGNGSLIWFREARKVINVSQCAKDADCSLKFRFQRTVLRLSGQNPNTIWGIDLNFGPTQFVMQGTPWDYLPQDSQDSSDTPGEANGKTIEYSASCDCKLPTKIIFELSKPQGVLLSRPGSSSNFGSQSPLVQDYSFEPSRNLEFDVDGGGQSMTTKTVTGSATAVVSSFDYGGVAILRAKVKVDGDWVYAESFAFGEFGEELPRASCAVDESDTRPFVQIPIDVNCNWIADSWEKPKAQAAGLGDYFPNRYWDLEKGGRATVANYIVLGDGFGAFDEYRGFHALNPFGQTIHVRTDAGKDLDQFYWDSSSDHRYRDAVRELIEHRVSGVVALHEVSQSQATKRNLAAGVELTELNFNSESADPLLLNFATHFYEIIGTDSILGDVGQRGKTGKPIRIRTNTLQSLAQRWGVDITFARAVVVAHELGHRFNLQHYIRVKNFNNGVTEANLSALNSNGYALDSMDPKKFYFEANLFWPPSATLPLVGDKINSSFAFATNIVLGNPLLAYPSPLPSGSPTAILQYTARDPVSTPDPIIVEVRRKFLMDWNVYADPTMSTNASWQFSTQEVNDVSLLSLNTLNPPI